MHIYMWSSPLAKTTQIHIWIHTFNMHACTYTCEAVHKPRLHALETPLVFVYILWGRGCYQNAAMKRYCQYTITAGTQAGHGFSEIWPILLHNWRPHTCRHSLQRNNIHTYMHTYIHALNTYMCCTCVCKHTYVCMYVSIHTYICMYTCASLRSVHVMLTYIYTYIHYAM